MGSLLDYNIILSVSTIKCWCYWWHINFAGLFHITVVRCKPNILSRSNSTQKLKWKYGRLRLNLMYIQIHSYQIYWCRTISYSNDYKFLEYVAICSVSWFAICKISSLIILWASMICPWIWCKRLLDSLTFCGLIFLRLQLRQA